MELLNAEWFSGWPVFLLAAFVVCLVLLFILLYRLSEADHKTSHILLLLIILSYTHVILVTFLVETKWISYVPHLYRTAVPVIYLILPFSFLYLKKLITQENFLLKDTIHFVFPFLVFISMVPFYIRSTEYKLQIISEDVHLIRYHFIFSQHSMISKSAFLDISFVFLLIYVALIIKWFFIASKPEYDSPLWYNPVKLRWVYAFTITCILPFLNFFFVFDDNMQMVWRLSVIGLCILAIASSFSLIFNPGILYNLYADKVLEPIVEVKSEQQESSSSDNNTDDVILLLETLMDKEYIFLMPKFSLFHLSSALGISNQALSSILLNEYGMNFHDYINQKRVDFICDGFTSGTFDGMNLEDIAQEAGFGNRTTFIQAFKKFKGTTPSDFFSKVKS
jgi:AraC-like DNA-binding protein